MRHLARRRAAAIALAAVALAGVLVDSTPSAPIEAAPTAPFVPARFQRNLNGAIALFGKPC